jgi:SAM-dependent methyltransferase
MATIDENKKYWDGDYAWPQRGDEWSKDWGAVPMQWYGTVLPRIHAFLSAEVILEIGCGYGRWTQYLKDHCKRLIAVDLSDECIRACRECFATDAHLSFYCNNGMSLAMVEDGSVDFVFSFDALPLADSSTIDAYLAQLPRVLKPDGVAFLHHSNLGAYKKSSSLAEKDLYWRDPGVSAELVEQMAAAHGLYCVSQEVFRWGTKRLLIEAFTVLTGDTSSWRRECVRLQNDWFSEEAANLSRLARLYVRPRRS